MADIKNQGTEPEVTEPTVEPTAPATDPKEPETPQLSVEEQIAQLRVENAKLKKSFDKTASEAATYKKQLREKQTADEIALQEKAEKEAEREEKFNKLLKENTVNKYKAKFLGLGYDAELAENAATAQFDNNTDELFDIQNKFLETKQAAIKADLMKSMPTPPMSNDTGDVDPFLKGFGK